MKVAARSLLALFLLAPLLWAAEPWKGRPYTEWTSKDVQKVLGDSPWTRRVSFRRTLSSGEQRRATSGVFLPGRTISSETRAQWFVVVQWESSLTVRQALVRQRQLRGKYSKGESAPFLSEAPTHYVITVFGTGDFFRDVPEETLREAAYLELGESKRRIPAVAARYEEERSMLAIVQFHFARQVGDERAIGPEVKKVKFVCQMKPDSFSADFDLRKMVRDGKPDL